MVKIRSLLGLERWTWRHPNRDGSRRPRNPLGGVLSHSELWVGDYRSVTSPVSGPVVHSELEEGDGVTFCSDGESETMDHMRAVGSLGFKVKTEDLRRSKEGNINRHQRSTEMDQDSYLNR